MIKMQLGLESAFLFLYNKKAMKNLNEDLKSGQLKSAYLLFGEEDYLKRLYRDRLVKAMVAEGDTMNYAYFEGKGIEVRALVDLAETMPFFAERRVIVLENSGLFKSGGADLAEYLGEMPDTAAFIFVENEVDKRGKLYKAVQKKGRAVELSAQDEGTLKRWIAGKVREEGKKISEQTILYFLNKVGTDMENITKELEKLFCYALEREEIVREDVDAICVMQISNHIFDMVNAVAEKNKRRALELYYELLALKEPPMRILFLMTRQYRILYQVGQLNKKGYARKEIAAKAGVPPFAVGKYLEQAKLVKGAKVLEILEDAADLEERVKTGRLTDTLAVELFIVKYSGA